MFVPLFDHLPIVSADAGHDLAGQSLWEWSHNDPGVYHNALEDPDSPVVDSSPHVWSYGEPVDISPDEPYSCYPLPCSAVSGADVAHSQSLQFIGGVGIDGGNGNATCIYSSCDDHDTYGISGSGWQGPGNGEDSGDLWNPAVKNGSSMGVSKALAVAPLASVPEEEAAPTKAARPSPSHMLLMGHAMLFGALSTIADKDVLSGKASFEETFKTKSADAAAAITPVGAYVLREKVFKQ